MMYGWLLGVALGITNNPTFLRVDYYTIIERRYKYNYVTIQVAWCLVILNKLVI